MTASAASASWPLRPTAVVLVATAAVELVLSRSFSGVGLRTLAASGQAAYWLSLVGTASLVATGVLATVLLFSQTSRLIGHDAVPGMTWRGMWIVSAPMVFLVAAWSVWSHLSGLILLVAVLDGAWLLLVLTAVLMRQPLGWPHKAVFGTMTLTVVTGIASWIALDFAALSHRDGWGAFFLGCYRIAEAVALLTPLAALWAFPLGGATRALPERLRALPKRALVAATAAGAATWGLLWLIQGVKTSPQLVHTTSLLVHIAYRTLGLTLSFPGAPWVFVVATAVGTATVVALLWSPGDRRCADRDIALGWTLFVLGGLQPLTVYQLVLTLCGAITLAIALLTAAQPPQKEGEPSDLLHMAAELDAQ